MVSEESEPNEYGWFTVVIPSVKIKIHKDYRGHHLDRFYEALKNDWCLVSVGCFGNSVEAVFDDTTDRTTNESGSRCAKRGCWTRS